jgi:outer membrane protein assembly factor BamB
MLHTYSSPCLGAGRLYVGEGLHANFQCRLYCLEANTGTKLWDFPTNGHIESSPCLAEGRVYFASGDDGIYCLDAESGRLIWQVRPNYHVDCRLAVSEGRVFGGSGVSRRFPKSEIFCLDAADGKVIWQSPTDLPAWGSPTVARRTSVLAGSEDLNKRGRLLYKDHVYFGLGNGRLNRSDPQRPAGALLCVQAATGRTVWRYDVPDAVLVQSTFGPEHVFFGARDGYCYCVDRQEGRLCWATSAGSPVVTEPALVEDRLYVVASGGQVYCLDASTGRPWWTFDLARYSQTSPLLFSSPVVEILSTGEGRRLYLGTELRQALSSAAVVYCLED